MTKYLIKNDDGSYSVIKARGFRPPTAVAVVPDSIDKSDYPFLYPETVTDPETRIDSIEIKVDTISKGTAILDDQKKAQESALHASYIADIDAEMIRIFGTTDRDKASALYNTWYEFLKDPAYFADKGLTDDQGLPLDTASKVTVYAQAKVNACKDYAVFLINREKQFKDARAAL